MTDDVISRAKAALQEYAEAKYHNEHPSGYPVRIFGETLELAESQAAQIAAIRERIKPWALCNSPNQTGYQAALEAILAAIFGILDGTTDD